MSISLANGLAMVALAHVRQGRLTPPPPQTQGLLVMELCEGQYTTLKWADVLNIQFTRDMQQVNTGMFSSI
jgi:hypothetical protein